MLCPACGTANIADAKFCVECGARLSVTCRSCGTPHAPGAKFCAECGTSLGTVGAPPSAVTTAPATSSPVAERRLVTVLFADLVGFTALAEGRDAEETRELLSRYFETSRAVIDRYGGTVEKFIGDAVMAVWGAPVTHEDDAERAVRAGLELVDAVAGIGESVRADLRARVGILTGSVAVTLGATDQGMVAGDIVNTASRLQSVATPGTVLVAEATRRATETAIAYEAAGDQVLKGKEEAVPTHRALRVLGRLGGTGRSDLLEAPFVGRQAELRLIKELVHTTGDERRPRVVTILGQGGIGKSRLAEELAKYLDGVTEVLYWHRGRCPAYGEGMSYWALAEMVRFRAEIAESEPDDTALPKLQTMLETFIADADERQWIEPPLRELLGMEDSSGSKESRETLFAAWRTLFERISERGTTILVFEDLQWADAGLLAFIEHLHQWTRSRPILVLALARPELLDRRSDWGAGWRNASTIGLEPLPEAAMRELLAGLVPGLPDGAVDRIVERAEGIPFYAVETVRMLLADGRIEPADGAYRPVGDLSDISVPDTIQALVAARLDGLEPEMRQVVAAASVLGKTFTLDALATVLDRDAASAESSLRDLVRRELLAVEVDLRSPEHGQYGFVQSLVREVAFGTLAKRDRRRLHLAAASHYERLGDDDLVGVLAGHYLDAYRAQPEGPEGEAAAAQARVALRAAADRAAALGSYLQALGHLRDAIEVTSDDGDRADLHLRAGIAATYATRYQEARAHLERALELHRARNDRPASLSAIVWAARTRLSSHDVDSAGEPLIRAAAEYEDLEGTVEYLELVEMLARLYMRRGDHADALAWCERGLRSPVTNEVVATTLELLVTRATVLGAEGRQTEAVAVLRGALEVAEEHGLTEVQVRAHINLGFVTVTDEPRVAFETSRRGLDLALRFGLSPYLVFLESNTVSTAYFLGEWDAAEAALAEALDLNLGEETLSVLRAMTIDLKAARGEPYVELLEATPVADDPQARAGWNNARALIALTEGRYAEAVELGLESVREFAEAVTPDSQAAVGRAGLWAGDIAPVAAALASLDTRAGRAVQAARIELESGVAALEGRTEEAIAGFRRLWRAQAELGIEFEGALSRITATAVLPRDAPLAREAAEEARATLTRLRAVRLLERLDEVLARVDGARGSGRQSPVQPSIEQASLK